MLARRYHALRIQSRITVLVIACVLPAWLYVGYLTVSSYDRGRQALEQTLQSAAQSQLRLFERELAAVTAALGALSVSPALDGKDYAGFYLQAQAVLAQSRGLNIVLLGADGSQIINTLRPYGDVLPTQPPPFFDRLKETGKPVLSDLFVGPVTGRPLISLAIPVYRDGSFAYVLGMSLDTEHLSPIIHLDGFPDSWAVAVYDRNGTIAARTWDPEKFVGQKAGPDFLRAFDSPRQGLIEATTLEGVSIVSAYSRSNLYGWVVNIGVPKSVLTAALTRSLWLGLLGGTILLVSGLALARGMSRGITRPIEALIAPAMALGQGETVEVPPLHLREADDVGRALTTAAALIRERTLERDLARINEQEIQQQHKTLRALNDIAALPGADPDWQLVESLRVGARHLGLPIGIISRVEGQRYCVLHHHAPPSAGLVDGQVFDLGSTYCTIALETKDVVAITHMGQSEHAGHPCYGTFGLETYIGIPLIVRDHSFGTVNFSSPTPFEREFDAGDLEFMRLLARWIGTVLDRQISDAEIASAKVELERSNFELEHFAFVASHDLRQPLRMVTSYLSLIERRMKGSLDGEIREFFHFAVDGARRMDQMIIDLLEYSRIGRTDPHKELVELDSAVAQALDHLGAAIDEAEAEIIHSPGFPVVLGNRSEMVRLFQNLIANAVKFRAPDRHPRIDIGFKDGGEEWIIAIADNGIGIAAADFDRLFAVFQRLVPREEYDGTGIGLAACRKICEHHGGRIWVESTPDQGTTFFVALPKAQ